MKHGIYVVPVFAFVNLMLIDGYNKETESNQRSFHLNLMAGVRHEVVGADASMLRVGGRDPQILGRRGHEILLVLYLIMYRMYVRKYVLF